VYQTLTFLYTDIEGSTRLWEQHRGSVEMAIELQDRILREAIEANGGRIFRTVGDGLCASFPRASSAVAAAFQTQRRIRAEKWEGIGELRVRIALHTGEVEPRDGDYTGGSLNRIGRILGVTHGGQILLSQATGTLVRDALPPGTNLTDLGQVRLRDLTHPERLYQLDHPELLSDFPPPPGLNQRPNNLPAQPSPLIGREVQLSEILHQLNGGGARLLTLLGPGGAGKTRLALQAAAELIDSFQDGVFFVDLAPVRDPGSILPEIARTVGVRETGQTELLEELAGELREREMLLLLDNFEQVTAAAPETAELLAASPRLKLLVTSREALRVRGEHIFSVPPLELPETDLQEGAAEELARYEAIQLFVERARAAKPDFQLTDENAQSVAEICQRLDGLPLAIELATVNLRLFPPKALLERLDSRLKMLHGGVRDLPVRQQTLVDTIGWSYDLLTPGEQRLFELLAVFPSCTVQAVEQVASGIEQLQETGVEALDGLASLVDKSLIRQIDISGEAIRLRMLETIREYALDKLEEHPDFSAAVRHSHASYFADFTQLQWELLSSPGREAALDDMSVEIENVRAAWRYWVEQGDLEQLGKFVDSLWMLYDARGWYQATVELTKDLLEVLSAHPSTPERAIQEITLQTSLARALMAIKGYTEEVEEAYRRALELCQQAGEIPQLVPVLRGLASFYTYRAEFKKATEMGKMLLHLAEQHDDDSMRVMGHLVVGANLFFLDQVDPGMEHLERSIQLHDPQQGAGGRFQLGNNPAVASLTTSALCYWMLGFQDRTLARAEQANALAEQLRHPFTRAYAIFHTGLLHLWRQEPELALDRAQAVIDIAEEHELQIWAAVGACLHGAALAGMGRAEEGIPQIEWGMEVYQGLRTPPVFWPNLQVVYAGALAQLGDMQKALALIDEALRIAGQGSGRGMLTEMLRLKGELLNAQAGGGSAQAQALFREALEISQETGALTLELHAAMSLYRLLQEQGQEGEGRRLLQQVYDKFTEGFDAPDLKAARELLKR
jgi:predicted ATPase/class 3 adenylate cyclase